MGNATNNTNNETTLGTIRNGRFTVSVLDELDPNGRPLYLIRGSRGACYGLLRNRNEKQLFVCNVNRPLANAGPFEGVWFTEHANGLESTAGDVVAL